MSWIDWTTLILGTVQALATVVALYFAWRAVQEARATRQAATREKRLAQLERMLVTVAEARRTYDYGSLAEQRRHVERLEALLRAAPRGDLPKTRAYVDHDPARPFPDQRYRDLGAEALPGARRCCRRACLIRAQTSANSRTERGGLRRPEATKTAEGSHVPPRSRTARPGA